VRTARFEAKTLVEGPGEHSALWLQGCSIRCPDCCNPLMQPESGGVDLPVVELARQIVAAGSDGLTLLGGEPLDQADEVFSLLQLLRGSDYHGIIMFTGYEWSAVVADAQKLRVAELCDLVIAGPYDRKKAPGNRRWIGSDNQTLHFITDHYRELQQNWPVRQCEIEIFIRDGEIMVNGTPLEADHELTRILKLQSGG